MPPRPVLKEQARLSAHLSTKIPLAEEKGISWRERGEEAMNKPGTAGPLMGWVGQGGGLLQDPQLLSCPPLGHLELPGMPDLLERSLELSKP